MGALEVLKKYRNQNKGREKTSALSDFKDPFQSDKVDTISFFIMKRSFGLSGYSMTANVNFKFDNTEGKQCFEADSFDELVGKVQNFIDEL